MTRDEAQAAAIDLLRQGHGFAIMGNVPIGYVDRYYHAGEWHDVEPWNQLEERGEPCKIVVGKYRGKKVYCTRDVESHGFYDGQCILTPFGAPATFEQLEIVARALGCDFEKRRLVWDGGNSLWTPVLKPSAHGRGPWHRDAAKGFTEKLIRQRLNPSEVMVFDHEITFCGVAGEETHELLQQISWLNHEAGVHCAPNAGFPVTQALKNLLMEATAAAEESNWALFNALCYGHKFIGGEMQEPFGEHYRDENCIADYLDGMHFKSGKLVGETERKAFDPGQSPTLRLIEQEHRRYYDHPLWWEKEAI